MLFYVGNQNGNHGETAGEQRNGWKNSLGAAGIRQVCFNCFSSASFAYEVVRNAESVWASVTVQKEKAEIMATVFVGRASTLLRPAGAPSKLGEIA